MSDEIRITLNGEDFENLIMGESAEFSSVPYGHGHIDVFIKLNDIGFNVMENLLIQAKRKIIKKYGLEEIK